MNPERSRNPFAQIRVHSRPAPPVPPSGRIPSNDGTCRGIAAAATLRPSQRGKSSLHHRLTLVPPYPDVLDYTTRTQRAPACQSARRFRPTTPKLQYPSSGTPSLHYSIAPSSPPINQRRPNTTKYNHTQPYTTKPMTSQPRTHSRHSLEPLPASGGLNPEP